MGNSSLTSMEVLDGIAEGELVVTNPPSSIDSITSANLIQG